MEVPLLDLKAQYATIRNEVMSAIEDVMESQYFIGGPVVEEFEKKIADYCECEAAVGVSSGTDALLCALMASEIGEGDEVITSPYTFFATAGSIWRVGAIPVFVDIRPDTFNIDTDQIEAAVTERTRAIMPVHLFGQTSSMDDILEIADEHDLAVIEDAAQAIGATYKGRKAGSMGTIGCFSFFPSKNLGGIGDGGMTVTQDVDLAERMRALRQHGAKQRYYHQWVGGNFRLDAIQAAALHAKLPHLDGWSAGRRENAARYNELFEQVDEVTTPTIREENKTVFNQYVIRVPRRNELQEFLSERDIGTSIYYPRSLHRQECFEPLGYKAGDFPESERAAVETLALPIFTELTDEQIQWVVESVAEFYAP
ncbi:MAG: DegT/DnrJ/EryC1/StrS family aminotransferase [Candidatus Brocadiia bacterium]